MYLLFKFYLILKKHYKIKVFNSFKLKNKNNYLCFFNYNRFYIQICKLYKDNFKISIRAIMSKKN